MQIGTDLPMVEITDLKKSYGNFEALKGVNFSVPRGQVVGFLGPNGAGKSTTMKILTGYLPYISGSVRIGGIEIANDAVSARKLIGYLPENNPQYEEMMVCEYLSFVADIRQLKGADKKSKIDSATQKCGLNEVYYKDIGQLSKGFRQRVGLAQAILHDPQLLILDEPTTGLDPNQIIEIRNLIKELGKQITVLMSTHILQEAHSTCERILIINNGLLVADDTPDKLVEGDYDTVYLEVISQKLSGDELNKKISLIPGINQVELVEQKGFTLSFVIKYENNDPRAELFNMAVDSKITILEMSKKKISLEDTFRRLTSAL